MLKAVILGSAAIAAVAVAVQAQGGAAAPARAAAAQPRSCDLKSIAGAFAGDPLTRVTLVKAFAKGQDLNLTGKPSGSAAANDLCLVKLLVGPGHPGPAEAPSTSSGISMEIWLPSPSNWNGRIHNLGGGGYGGDPTIGSATEFNGGPRAMPLRSDVAGLEGAVSGSTDGGHVGRESSTGAGYGGPGGAGYDASWAMNPDGRLNTTLWKDFASRSIHELAVKTRTLTAAYYGRPARYSYFEGCSLGGRQGYKSVQDFPADYDGVLAGHAGVGWTNFVTAMLYPQLLYLHDLGGQVIPPKTLELVSAAAISACDTDLNGEHAGYISDPAACRYDPTKDPKVLCKADGGENATDLCVTRRQAQTINKIWYGQTADAHAPDPQAGNGYGSVLDPGQLWFGLPRGVDLRGAANSVGGAPSPFPIPVHQIALTFQDARMAGPDFVNAAGSGENGWKRLSYADLARAQRQGAALQDRFDHINTQQTDLRPFRARKGKLLSYHGMADPMIPVQGSLRYYDSVAARMGGHAALQDFYRLYLVPGMGHCFGTSVNGLPGVSPTSDPPLPRSGQLYEQLVAWVEEGKAPNITIENASRSVKRPLCAYPQQLKYVGGPRGEAGSYRCA